MHVLELPGFLSKGYTTIYGFLVSSIFISPPVYFPTSFYGRSIAAILLLSCNTVNPRIQLSHYIRIMPAPEIVPAPVAIKKRPPARGAVTNQQLPIIIIPTIRNDMCFA